MTQYVSRNDFKDWFKNRPSDSSYRDMFSDEALDAMFDYYEDFEESGGGAVDFDPIAFCCEWSEFNSLEDVKANYGSIETLEDLQNNTTVIELEDGRLLIQDF